MSQICFKCNTNPCTCGAVYREADKKQLLDAMYCCAKELRTRFDLKVDCNIDNMDLTDFLSTLDDTPLFLEDVVMYINNNDVPRSWKNYLENAKDKTVADLHEHILKSNPDTFSMLGMFTFIFFVLIDYKEKRPLSHIFMKSVKTLLQRETFVREIIESCSSNYSALIPKLKVIVSDTSNWNTDKGICFIIHSALQEDYNKSLSPVNCINYIYKLIQLCVFEHVVDHSSSIRLYEDELFYFDEALFNNIKNIPTASDLDNVKLV